MQYAFKSLGDMEWTVQCLGQHEPALTCAGYRALGPSPPKGISGGDSSPRVGGDLSPWGSSSWGASSWAWGATDNTQASVAPSPSPAPLAFPRADAIQSPEPPPDPPPRAAPPVKAVPSTPPIALTDAHPAIKEGTSAASAGPYVAPLSAFELPSLSIGVNSGNLMLGSSADPRDHVLNGALARITMLEAVVQQVPFLNATATDFNTRFVLLDALTSAFNQRLGLLESLTSMVGTGLDLTQSPLAYHQSGEPETGPPGLSAMTEKTARPSEKDWSDLSGLLDSAAV